MSCSALQCLAVPCTLCFVNVMAGATLPEGFQIGAPVAGSEKGVGFWRPGLQPKAMPWPCHGHHGHRCQAGWPRKSTTAGARGSQWTGGVEGVLYCRTEMKVAMKLVECVE